MPKKTRKIHDPSFIFNSIKSNPDNCTIVGFLDPSGIKRIYLFPEGRQLSEEERIQFVAGMLVSLVRPRVGTDAKRKPSSLSARNRHGFHMEEFIGDKAYHDLKAHFYKKVGRYEKWRKKQK